MDDEKTEEPAAEPEGEEAAEETEETTEEVTEPEPAAEPAYDVAGKLEEIAAGIAGLQRAIAALVSNSGAPVEDESEYLTMEDLEFDETNDTDEYEFD